MRTGVGGKESVLVSPVKKALPVAEIRRVDLGVRVANFFKVNYTYKTVLFFFFTMFTIR